MIAVAACRPRWTGPLGGRPLTGGLLKPSVVTCDDLAGLA
jgi:hypothetical protein